MKNIELRNLIKERRLFHYEVADALNISDSAFSKMLRRELLGEEKERVLGAIESLTGDGVVNNE